MSPVANPPAEQSQRSGNSAASASGNPPNQVATNTGQTRNRAQRQPLSYAAVGTPENLQKQYRQQATEAAMESIHLPHLENMKAQLSSWDQPGDKRIFERVSRYDLRDTVVKLSQQGTTIMVLKNDKSQLEEQKHSWQLEQKEFISDLSLSQEEVQRQKEMLFDRDSHILSLNQKLSGTEAKLADRNNENGQLKRQLKSQGEKLADRDSEVIQLKQQLASTGKDTEIHKLQQVVQQLRQQLDQQNAIPPNTSSEASPAKSLTLAELHKRNQRRKAAINTYLSTSAALVAMFQALVNGGDFDVE